MAGYDPSLFPGISGSGSSKTPSFGLPFAPSSTGQDLTANQLALLLALQKRDKHFSLGHMLKEAGKHTLNPVLWTFDKIMRPSYAVANATDKAISSGGDITDTLSGAWKGFSGKEKMGFGEVMSRHGVLKGHGHLRGIVGFGADVVTDPLFLASVAAAPFTGGGSVAGYAALKAAAEQGGKKLAEDVLVREARKAAFDAGRHAIEGKVDDNVLEILQKAGKGYEARLGLANQVKREKQLIEDLKIPEGSTYSDALVAERSIAADIAHAEEKRVTKYGPQLGWGTRKHKLTTPVEIGGRRVVPELPKMATIAMRGVPGISHITNKVGEKFIPGFKREELHAAEIGRQHYAEASAVNQRNAIADIMAGKHLPEAEQAMNKEIQHLTHEEQMHALHLFEQPLKTRNGKRWAAVKKIKGIHGEDAYVINQKYVDHLIQLGSKGDVTGISPAQAEFVKRFHHATQYLYVRDKMAGVKYKQPHLGEQGRLYVPHIMDRSGDPLATTQLQKNIFSEAGFQKKRMRAKMSLSQINDLVKSGKLPDAVETDPYKLLTHTSRSRAEKQADMAMIHSIERAYGIPTRIVDKARVDRAVKRAKTAANKFKAAERVAADAEHRIENKITLFREHKISEHNALIASLEKKIRAVKFGKLDNKKVAKAIHAANEAHDALLAKLERDVKTKVTKLTNAAKKAREEADKAENAAERAIAKGNKSWITRATKLAAQKMDLADNLEEALAKLPKEVPAEQRAALAEARDKAIEKARATGRLNQRRTKNATIKVIQNRIERANIAHALEIQKIERGTHPELKKMLAEDKLSLKTAREALTDARKELNQAKKSWNAALLGKKNPLYKGNVHKVVGKSTDEWGNKYAYPKEVAHSMERLRKITTGDEKTVDDFAKGWGKFMSTWKLLVTSVNPGYRFRNSMTDFWNMWVSGVPAVLIPKYGKQAVEVMVRAKKGDIEALNIITQAATHGVLSGLYTGDVQAVAKFIRMQGTRSTVRHPGRAYVKLMQDVNRNAENWGRLTHYLYQTRSMHLSPSEAALKVKLAHFDYEDLTPFEQKVMKRIFPFYTWTRKNIPFQVKMIMQHPGRYAAFPKMANEAEFQSGADPNEEIPGYLSDNLAFHIGKHRVFSPQFGVSDLVPFQSPKEALQRVESMVTPVIKTPVEMALNKSFFSGQPIASDTHPRNPVNSLGASLLSLIPGSDVGQTSRQGVTGPGANPYYAYLLSQIPMLRQATISTGGIKGKRPGTDPWLSYLGGLSTQTYDPAEEQQYATRAAQKEATKLLTGLRDAGLIPPAKRRKLSAKEKYIQSQIFGP